MAQRRMFSKSITESDEFLDMPLSTQALYFHLGMQADDDGFVSAGRITRMIGSSSDELKVLVLKKFVIPFNNNVLVVRHWKVNNDIKKDRYKPTLYSEEKAQLECIQNVYTLDTECNPRLGKVRLDEVRLGDEKEQIVDNIVDKSGDKEPKDGDTVSLKDGTKALRYFGRWVDANNVQTSIDLDHYKELQG